MRIVKSALIALILTLAVFGLASASYTGPNRTVTTTTWERQYCNYRATVVSPAGSCLLTLYFSPGSCPSASSVAGFFNNAQTACGTSWPGTCGAGLSCNIALLTGSTQGCSSGETGCTQSTSTTTYPPASVSGSTVCSIPGNNGWCRGTGTIDLSGSEPLSGYSITGIEGYTGLLCSGPACAWAFPEGITNLTFWALSSWGDTSTTGSASLKVDSLAPTLMLTLPPANGQNGWFVSGPVTASASATDATSGLNSVSINGGSASFTVSLDGTYPLNLTATDNAGNMATTNGTINLDTTPPSLSVSIPPVDGSNGWYTSVLQFLTSGEDAISGVQGIAHSLDGGGSWQSGTLSLSEGRYTVITRITDFAGNFTIRTNSINVDPTPPQSSFTLPPEGTTTLIHDSFTMNGQTFDLTSGPAGAEISVDGGTTWIPLAMNGGSWSYTWDTNSVPNGTYLLLVRASDVAGNMERTAHITVVVANKEPEVSIPQPPPTLPREPPAVPVSTSNSILPVVPVETSNALPPAPIVPTGIDQEVAPTQAPAPVTGPSKIQVNPRSSAMDPVYLWPILGLGGLLAALGSSSWSDRRPSALHRLENALTTAATRPESTNEM